MSSARALWQGAWTVVRSPGIVVLVVFVTIASAVPFALLVGAAVQESLANRPPVAAPFDDIDGEWWMQFRAQASGLAATFAPTILGFAAPLSNLSALLDGTPLPWSLLAPLLLTLVVWSVLWGGILDRYAVAPSGGFARFGRSAVRFAPRMLAAGGIAALVNLLLYFTLHPLLFGVLYESLASGHDRNAFIVRVVLYVMFGAALIGVSVIADYTRIAIVTHDRSVSGGIRGAIDFVRRQWVSVALLYVLIGLLFVAGFVGYGLVEAYGGSHVGGWRAVAIGQAFVFGRIGIRLMFAASEVQLFRAAAAPTA